MEKYVKTIIQSGAGIELLAIEKARSFRKTSYRPTSTEVLIPQQDTYCHITEAYDNGAAFGFGAFNTDTLYMLGSIAKKITIVHCRINVNGWIGANAAALYGQEMLRANIVKGSHNGYIVSPTVSWATNGSTIPYDSNSPAAQAIVGAGTVPLNRTGEANVFRFHISGCSFLAVSSTRMFWKIPTLTWYCNDMGKGIVVKANEYVGVTFQNLVGNLSYGFVELLWTEE